MREAIGKSYNSALRELARSKRIPIIDFEAEVLKRRPNDWNGTLLGKNDVHPSSSYGGATPSSEPSEANLRNSGLLLGRSSPKSRCSRENPRLFRERS